MLFDYSIDHIITIIFEDSPAYYGELCDPSALHPCEDGYGMECKEAYDLTASTCECKEGMTFGTYGFCEEGKYKSCFKIVRKHQTETFVGKA